jgi:predicted O-methyltransferase YrrM
VSRSVLRRAGAKLSTVRPFPQIRVVRTYGASARKQPLTALRYLVSGRETSNFTYEIANRDELAAVVAGALDAPQEEIRSLIAEADADADLRLRLQGRALFGRRLGWYAALRWRKPALAVETGTADGLGTALLARAIERNAEDGAPGRLLSFDVVPSAGHLLDDHLRQFATVVVGDAVEALPVAAAGERIGYFVHDSLHTYEHERAELDVATAHADGELVLISDNAHATTALADVAAEHGARYAAFREQPVRHLYPGAALGIAVVRTTP